MSEHDTAHDSNSPSDHAGRHATIDFEDGGCIVYDRENPQAWIQADSDEAVAEVRA